MAVSPYRPVYLPGPLSAPSAPSATGNSSPLTIPSFTTMSTYSSSSSSSVYSSVGPSNYTVVTPGMMSDPRNLSQASPGFVYVNSALDYCSSTSSGSRTFNARLCFPRLSSVLSLRRSAFRHGIALIPATDLKYFWAVANLAFPERQRSTDQLSTDPSGKHIDRTSSHREDFRLPQLSRSH